MDHSFGKTTMSIVYAGYFELNFLFFSNDSHRTLYPSRSPRCSRNVFGITVLYFCPIFVLSQMSIMLSRLIVIQKQYIKVPPVYKWVTKCQHISLGKKIDIFKKNRNKKEFLYQPSFFVFSLVKKTQIFSTN